MRTGFNGNGFSPTGGQENPAGETRLPAIQFRLPPATLLRRGSRGIMLGITEAVAPGEIQSQSLANRFDGSGIASAGRGLMALRG